MWRGLHFKGTAQQWYHKHWQKWGHKLSKLGLDTPHLRRALPTKHARSEHVLTSVLLPERVLEFFSVSTKALLILLPEWVHRKEQCHKKAGDNACAWNEVLEGLLRRWGNLPKGTELCIDVPVLSNRSASTHPERTEMIICEVSENQELVLRKNRDNGAICCKVMAR